MNSGNTTTIPKHPRLVHYLRDAAGKTACGRTVPARTADLKFSVTLLTDRTVTCRRCARWLEIVALCPHCLRPIQP